MTYRTHNDDPSLDANLTCLQGSIRCSFQELVQHFGPPLSGDGCKTDAEWVIKTADGNTITIYNWKNGKAYNGRSGTAVEFIRDWHVGGFKREAVTALHSLLAQPVPIAA